MNQQPVIDVFRTRYDRDACKTGIVHLGLGAFHRAHQAVFIDDYMDKTGDLNWGIAAINLRPEEAASFQNHLDADHGYLLKTTNPDGVGNLREIRSHVEFKDWSRNATEAEAVAALSSVKVISMTVTESGYYLTEDWTLDERHPLIAAEIEGSRGRSIYAYLAKALEGRILAHGEPVTIVCCDNIRSNGDVLAQNFRRYLDLTGKDEIINWLDGNATFPNSMVDRITPRSTMALREEVSRISPGSEVTAVHSESYIQWVIEDRFASDFPALASVGVELVRDVMPFEEAKIRILNGGHSALCYLGALAGHATFDQAMADENLRPHFDGYQHENVLPAITVSLPFNKLEYSNVIAERLSNSAIADELGRICMDGWSKFPIFVRPTLEDCLKQGINPEFGYDSVASWYVFARRHLLGLATIPYVDTYWETLKPLLANGQEARFAELEALWADLPQKYNEFVPGIVSAIIRMEEKWPV